MSELLKPITAPYKLEILKADNVWTHLGDLKIPQKDSINYTIACMANNGGVTQKTIAMKDKNSGEWFFATRIKRAEKVVYQEIDSKFPYKDNKIKWDMDFGISDGLPIPDSILDKFYPIKN